MNKAKNYIFCDPYELIIDIDIGSAFRKALKSDVMFGICPYNEYLGPEKGPIVAVKNAMTKLIVSGDLKNFVVLTKRRALFAGEFVPNNVIDVTDKTPEQVAAEVDWVFSGFGRDKVEDPFIIGDSHFWHKNIIKYCNRPWNSGHDENGNLIVTDADVVKMNEDMISNWNSVVGKDDIVYSTGDFCFGGFDKVKSIFDRLNGRKRLVLGNHDKLKFKQYYEIGFERVYDHPIILQSFLILSHQPVEWVSKDSVYGNVYAHVHDNEAYKDCTANTFCSSAERIEYTPIRLSEIMRQCKATEESIEMKKN